MNKKAQGNIGTVLVSSFIFVLLIISGFNLYLGTLYANDADIPDSIDEDKLNKAFSRFNSSFVNTTSEIDDQKNRIPILSEIADFFATGADSIKAAWDSIGFMNDYINFAKDNTVFGKILPDTFWGLLVSVFSIILVFIGLSALWRWNLTK